MIQDSLSKRYLAAYRTPLPNNWLRTELIAASQQSGRLSLVRSTQAARQEEAVGRSLPHRTHRPTALTRRGGQQMASSSYISVTRVAMDAAITELRSTSTPCVAAVARKYGLVTLTLRRRWKGRASSRDQAIEDSRFLNSQQEQQLLSHIKQLCDRCLPPTPAIMADIAAQLGGKAPGHNWCSRFVQ
jgi:transposase-like protein